MAAGMISGGKISLGFAAEVVIALGLFVGGRVVPDAAPDGERARFDVVGAVLSAAGLGLVVFAVLQSGSWGWVAPKIPDGASATPSWLGLSPVIWLLVGGLLTLWCFILWQQHRVAQRRAPLVDPSWTSTPPPASVAASGHGGGDTVRARRAVLQRPPAVEAPHHRGRPVALGAAQSPVVAVMRPSSTAAASAA